MRGKADYKSGTGRAYCVNPSQYMVDLYVTGWPGVHKGLTAHPVLLDLSVYRAVTGFEKSG